MAGLQIQILKSFGDIGEFDRRWLREAEAAGSQAF